MDMKITHFFSFEINKAQTLALTYDLSLLLASIIMAVLAGYSFYAAEELITYRKDTVKNNVFRLLAGVMLAVGVWNTHFIGMLAIELTADLKYNSFVTWLSVIPIFLTAMSVIHFISMKDKSIKGAIIYGFILAVGITAMHVIGMSALSVDAIMVHDPYIFIISFLISWLMASFSLFICNNDFEFILNIDRHFLISAKALLFGGAIALMHYLAMYSVYFLPLNYSVLVEGTSVENLVNTVVFSASIFILSFYIITQFKINELKLKRRVQDNREQMLDIVDYIAEPFVFVDKNNHVQFINKCFYKLFPNTQNLLESRTKVEAFLLHFFSLYDTNKITTSDPELKKYNQYKFTDINNRVWLIKKERSPNQNSLYHWTDITVENNRQKHLLEEKDRAFSSLQSRQAKELELLEAKRLTTVNHLVSNLSHDLNTPLGVVLTTLSCIEDDSNKIQQLFNDNALRKKNWLDFISGIDTSVGLASRNLLNALNILEKLQHVCSLKENKEEAVTVLLKAHFNEFKRCLYEFDGSRESEYEYQLHVDDNLTIQTKKSALLNVLMIIYENSLGQGAVSTSAGKIYISATVNEDNVLIKYQDNGVGLLNTNVRDIFEPFYAGMRKNSSNDLSLYIAKNIVEKQLLGSIKIEESDKFPVFIVELPTHYHG